MLLSDAESKTISCAKSQAAYGPRAVVDLVHAGTHFVRNSGDPVDFSCFSHRRRNGEG